MNVKGNWEEYILSCIDLLDSDDRQKILAIQSEIKQCYCFEFIERNRYDELLLLIEERRKFVIRRNELFHEQRMFEIRENRKKLEEQAEIRQVLIKADDEWRKANVRRGRKPKLNIMSE